MDESPEIANIDCVQRHPTPRIRLLMAASFIAPLCFWTAGAAVSDPAKLPAAAVKQVDFLKDIQPILAGRCYSCHGPEKQKSELRWDTKASLTKTGEHGPVLIPGDSAGSRVIRLVAGLDPDTVMPAKG